MEIDEAVVWCFAYQQWKRRKQLANRQKYRVHPILTDRGTHGMFVTLYPKLREYEHKFANYLRMSIKSFDELLELIRDGLSPCEKYVSRNVVSAEEKLVITLRYLATGCYFADLHYTHRLGQATVNKIVKQTCDVIWTKLKNIVMKEPTKEKWEQISKDFEKYTNFPNCIGAIDGKHFRITKPPKSGSLYYNYKGFYSTVLLAICDANYCFISIDVGAYGKSNDSAIFQNSIFYKKLMHKNLNIPESKPISEKDTTLFPYVIVGDQAFGLSEHILRPYCGETLNHRERIFNYRLSRARRYIESSFGIMTNKWRIFERPINVNIEFTKSIIQTCCVLHNYVRLRDGCRYDRTPCKSFVQTIITGTIRPNANAPTVRDRFADFFVNEGQLLWQDEVV